MAQIPGADGIGFAVPQPSRSSLFSPEAYGAGLGRTIEQVGQQMVQADHAEAVAQARARETADRAVAAQRIKRGEEQLAILADQLNEDIRLGRVDKAAAQEEWGARSAEFAQSASGEVPSAYAGDVSAALQTHGLALSRQVRRTVAVKDQEDTRASLQGLLEGYERDAATDRGGALKNAAASIAMLGPAAGFGSDDQARILQSLKERTAYSVGDRLILQAGRDAAALDGIQKRIDSDEFSDLSPERRQTLELRIANRRQAILHEQEVMRNRLEAAQAKRLRDAEHAYTAAQGVVDAGTMLDDASVESMQRLVSGTPYEPAFRQLVASGAQRATFGSLAPDQQQATLQQLRAEIAQKGASPATVDRLRKFESIAAKTEEAVNADPLAWGLQSRLLTERIPLQMDSLQSIVATVGARVQQADVVGAQLRRPVSPLFSQEAKGLADMLKVLPVQQRASAIQMIASALPGDQAQALAAQIDAKDRPMAIAFALGAQSTTRARPSAELVLKGAEAIANRTIKKDDRVIDGWQAQISKELDGVYGSPQRTQMVVEASKYILAGQVAEGTVSSAGARDFKDAISLAAGGEVIERNGSKIVRPAGVDQRSFDARLSRYPRDELMAQLPDGKVYLRGQAIDADRFLAGLPAAKLRTLGRGLYGVIDSGTFVANQAGQPILIEVKNAR